MSLEFLKNIKKGDIVVRALHGGGFTSNSLMGIEEVNEDGIFIEDADGDYSDDSVYKFSLTTGKSVNNYTQGFHSEIIRIATEEDLVNEDFQY